MGAFFLKPGDFSSVRPISLEIFSASGTGYQETGLVEVSTKGAGMGQSFAVGNKSPWNFLFR